MKQNKADKVETGNRFPVSRYTGYEDGLFFFLFFIFVLFNRRRECPV